MQREELLDRYRDLRALSARHHSAALGYVARPAMLERAKHLGLAFGQTLVADSEEEVTLVFDLALHTAKPGRSRAIDRYAKAARFAGGSDEACLLDAMRQAQFSIWRVRRHHEVAGLIVTDALREKDIWLLDEALTRHAPPDMGFAGRLFWPAEFAMTCGAVVPIDPEVLEDALLESSSWLRHTDRHQMADDPRFAAAIYRSALDAGGVTYQEVSAAA